MKSKQLLAVLAELEKQLFQLHRGLKRNLKQELIALFKTNGENCDSTAESVEKALGVLFSSSFKGWDIDAVDGKENCYCISFWDNDWLKRVELHLTLTGPQTSTLTVNDFALDGSLLDSVPDVVAILTIVNRAYYAIHLQEIINSPLNN